MKLNSDNFDLLMTILEVHAEERDVPGLANDAHDLMDKRMRFSRLCTGPEGQDYVDIFMYESEAVEMIWQLLFAAADADMAVNDYHRIGSSAGLAEFSDHGLSQFPPAL